MLVLLDPLSLVLVVSSGDPAAALRLSSQLISLGADVSLRSRWTNMNALHYAAYFDVPELIRVLLKASKPRGTHSSPELQSSSSGSSVVLSSDTSASSFISSSVELHMQ